MYAFYKNIEVDGENPTVLIWDDMNEVEYIDKKFEENIFRKMLEAKDSIDKDDLYVDYGKDNSMELYRTDLINDLKSITPYLKKEYVSILEETYNGEVFETLISYGFKGSKPLKDTIQEMLDFEYLNEVFKHEV